MWKCVYICTVYLCIFVCAHTQVHQDSPCETPNKQRGMCINVYDCKVVTDLLSNSTGVSAETKNFVRSLSCGYKGNNPLVCCPQPATRNVISTAKPTTNLLSTEPLTETESFLAPPKCGLSNVTLPKVVGGVPAKLGEFPWIVALGYQNRKNPNQPKWLCGGSLITHQHVITAAHCVYNRRDLYLARVGELDLYDENDGADPTDIPLLNAKIHENYSHTKFTSDIAILTLSRSTENLISVWPICLPWEQDKRSNSFLGKRPFVAGWGALYFNGPSSSSLQLATIPILDNSNCMAAYENTTVIDERIICAGYPQGEKDACQGDSGGPLMYGTIQRNDRSIQFYLIGIVSYGFRCAEAGYPGVYTRVTHFLNWIGKNIH